MTHASRAKPKASSSRRQAELEAFNTYKQALEAMQGGNHGAAIVLYRQTIAQQPGHFGAHNFLGSSLREQGDLIGALASYRKAIELQPYNMDVRVHVAETQRRLGLLHEAIETCDLVLSKQKRNANAQLIRGLARKGLGDVSGAVADMREAANRDGTASTFKMLARVLMEADRKVEAIAPLEAAIGLDAKDFETLRLLGDCFCGIGQVDKAFDAYRMSIDLNPKNSSTYANLAGMLCFTGQVDMAIAAGKIAIRLDPNMYEAHFNLAMSYEIKLEIQEAVAAYAEAIRCKPDLGVALLAMCRLLRQECDWDGMEAAETLAQELTYKKGIAASPFGLLSMASTPSNLLECNRLWAQAMPETFSQPLETYAPRPLPRRNEKIRIGYLSADFHTHATAALISEVLELHDKTRFEIFGYSIGNLDHSEMRRRILNALDHFVDLNALSHRAAAAKIRDDEIDILIDLKGYTYQARPQILAHRPAPIQVNYLGYPSTMGATFIDYMIADAIVAPTDHQSYFEEKVVHLPNSYQPNDRKRVIGSHVPSRSDCGLPNEGFIFCCFNANYKLNTQIFDSWIRILDAVPGSVLWLLASNSRAPENLRREASARGIDPMRLIFAPKLRVEDHLARMELGDLFLDTLPIGAHTTASEALWTGVPVLTCLGDAFPGRVGASLLRAIGLPELIMPTLAAYEATALRLALNPAEMVALKTKLRANRKAAPLFDAVRYTRNYEAALTHMMDLRDRAEVPVAFQIDEDPRCQPTPWV